MDIVHAMQLLSDMKVCFLYAFGSGFICAHFEFMIIFDFKLQEVCGAFNCMEVRIKVTHIQILTESLLDDDV